jgi:hypothetical protein
MSTSSADLLEFAQMDIAERYPCISYQHPSLFQLPTGTILGSFSYSIPGKIRYILNKSVEIAPGLLPADLTRAWLRADYNLPVKLRKAQLKETSYPIPFRAKHCDERELAYVDMTKAFVNFLTLGYDLEYVRGRYIGVRISEVPDIIRQNKLCYAVAVSMSNSQLTNISIMGKDGPFVNHAYNVFSNPLLYNLVRDGLAAIARDMLDRFGDLIHYVNCDGYIIERDKSQDLIEALAEWGFHARVKNEGVGRVNGLSSYWIGGVKTVRQAVPGSTDGQSDLPTVDETRWLKIRLQKFMEVVYQRRANNVN